jgi:flagellar protein FliO/FliZ
VLELILRIGFSLLIIFGIMWLLAKVARKPLAGRAGGALAVIGRQQLTRGASVALVRVADRTLIVGVTENQVTLLGETEESTLVRPAAQPVEVREPVALVDTTASGPAAPGLTSEERARREGGALEAMRPARAERAQSGTALDGSLLSPRTWSQTVAFLRDRTVRR